MNKPMLFNAEMVRAIIDGRKTQTRRSINPQPSGLESTLTPAQVNDAWQCGFVNVPCPFGEIGDLLWVRETFRCNGWATDIASIFYKAHEYNSYTQMCQQYFNKGRKVMPITQKWTPSIHMPKWVSRTTLKITSVRIEKLDDITEIDALCEGITLGEPEGIEDRVWPSQVFHELWAKIYGEDSLEANPWVWVVEFEVINKNILDVIGESK